MKLTLTHRNHAPSKSIVEMIEAELKSIERSLKIDEARVHVERGLTAIPSFHASFHLVTPGPDVIIKSTDHTLRAAILKAFDRIAAKIGHRDSKRTQRKSQVHFTTLPRRVTA